jgi:serine/threonine protein phosphatase PrpC
LKSKNLHLKVYARTDVGRVRDNNEDAFVIADLANSSPIHVTPHPLDMHVQSQGVLLAVSDGMGGAQAGEVASALTLRALRSALAVSDGDESPDVRLTRSVECANQEVWNLARDTGRLGMGATLTAVLVHGTRAYVAEIGDSRAYLLRDERLIQLTRDQNISQILVDTGRLTREQAEVSRYKNIITQAIGTRPKVVVALNRVGLRRGDILILCSDGLSTKVKDEEIRSTLATGRDLDAACMQLIDVANYRGGEDNVTVMLAEVEGEMLRAGRRDDRVSLETLRDYDGRDGLNGVNG